MSAIEDDKTPATAPIPIAYVHSYAALYGSEQSMLVTLRHLDRSAFTPRLLLPCEGSLVAAARDAGLDVDILPWLAQARSPNLRARLATTIRLGWWLGSRNIRLLHLNMWENGDGGTHLLAAKLAGATYLLGIRCRMDDYLSPRDQLWLSRTACIVSVSEDAVKPIFARRRFDHFWHVRPEQITIIPPSRDTAALRRTDAAPDAALEALGLTRDGPIVGSVAAINPIKRPDLFLRTAALLAASRPDLQFLMIGDSYVAGIPAAMEFVARIKELARELGLDGRVAFAGFRPDAVALMKRFTVLVVTSSAEGHSGVAIEAMAVGVPVVASAVGGIPETLREAGTGTLIDSSDPADYADAAARYLDDPDHAREVADRAKAAVERFDADRATRRLEECYRAMLRN